MTATKIRAALEAELDAALEESNSLIDAIMSVITRALDAPTPPPVSPSTRD
jgi:hypothetical protein